jgi:hypothetical protein
MRRHNRRSIVATALATTAPTLAASTPGRPDVSTGGAALPAARHTPQSDALLVARHEAEIYRWLLEQIVFENTQGEHLIDVTELVGYLVSLSAKSPDFKKDQRFCRSTQNVAKRAVEGIVAKHQRGNASSSASASSASESTAVVAQAAQQQQQQQQRQPQEAVMCAMLRSLFDGIGIARDQSSADDSGDFGSNSNDNSDDDSDSYYSSGSDVEDE